ncbi:MAG: hypothetical protein COT14_03345 [Candidatus Diapherotrites archaeon CG08_land_8_20_14_0_20_30_16]|nr:MAG: hypothetical protein COT14_03345 [Candidatus Diapherotrites archaeon CG08_land_8_20_14_0_20_30_16]
MASILVFGDSISYGIADKEGGWVPKLRKFLELDTDIKPNYDFIYNLSIPGDTSQTLLQRFTFEAMQRIDYPEETIVLFAFGINDSAYANIAAKPLVPENDFTDNVKDLVVKAKALKVQVAFLGLTQVDESRVNPCEWDKTVSYSNQLISKYNAIIKKICKEYDVYFIDISDSFKPSPKLFLDDGLHPNSKGHDKIFDQVRQFFSKYVLVFKDK